MDIIYKPSEIWDLYLKVKDSTTEDVELAYSLEFETTVYLSVSEDNPCICVDIMGDIIECEPVFDRRDAFDITSRIYAEYLDDQFDNISGFSNSVTQELEIEDREIELEAAVDDFLTSVLEVGEVTDELIKECKEAFLMYLTKKHGFKIFRPCFVNGEYTEHPY